MRDWYWNIELFMHAACTPSFREAIRFPHCTKSLPLRPRTLMIVLHEVPRDGVPQLRQSGAMRPIQPGASCNTAKQATLRPKRSQSDDYMQPLYKSQNHACLCWAHDRNPGVDKKSWDSGEPASCPTMISRRPTLNPRRFLRIDNDLNMHAMRFQISGHGHSRLVWAAPENSSTNWNFGFSQSKWAFHCMSNTWAHKK